MFLCCIGGRQTDPEYDGCKDYQYLEILHFFTFRFAA